MTTFNQQSQGRIFSDSKRQLERLSRTSSQKTSEISVVISTGSKTTVCPAKIKSLCSHNIYNLCLVELGSPGSEPTEIGGEMQAVNLAESFTSSGQLSAGTFVPLFMVGSKNIFYAPV